MERKDNLIIDVEISEERLSDIFNQERVLPQVKKLEKEMAPYIEEGLRSLKASRAFYKFINSQEGRETVNTAIRSNLLNKAITLTLKHIDVSLKTALLIVLTQENFKEAVDDTINDSKAEMENFTGSVRTKIGMFL